MSDAYQANININAKDNTAAAFDSVAKSSQNAARMTMEEWKRATGYSEKNTEATRKFAQQVSGKNPDNVAGAFGVANLAAIALGASVGGITGSVIGLGQAGYTAFGTVQEAMTRLRIMTGATKEEADHLKHSFEEMASETGKSVEELAAEFARFKNTSGLAVEETAKLFPKIVEQAFVTQASIEATGRAVATAMKQMHVPIEQVPDMLDAWALVLPGIQNEFASFLGRIGQDMATFGFKGEKNVNDLAAVFSTFTGRMGGDTGRATAEIEHLWKEMVEKNQLNMQRFAMTTAQHGESVWKVFEEIDRKVTEMAERTGTTRERTILNMFPRDEVMRNALTMVHDNIEAIEAMRKASETAAGTVEKFRKALGEDVLAQFRALNQQFKELSEAIGAVADKIGAGGFMTGMIGAVKEVKDLMESVNHLLDRLPSMPSSDRILSAPYRGAAAAGAAITRPGGILGPLAAPGGGGGTAPAFLPLISRPGGMLGPLSAPGADPGALPSTSEMRSGGEDPAMAALFRAAQRNTDAARRGAAFTPGAGDTPWAGEAGIPPVGPGIVGGAGGWGAGSGHVGGWSAGGGGFGGGRTSQRRGGSSPGAPAGGGDHVPMSPTGARVTDNLVTVTSPSGKSVRVAPEMAENTKGFLADYEAAGGVIGPNTGGAGSRPNPSYHPQGMAFDLNQVARNKRAGGKTLSVEKENEIADKWGLRPGSRFSSPDAGHFEMNSRSNAASALVKQGKELPAGLQSYAPSASGSGGNVGALSDIRQRHAEELKNPVVKEAFMRRMEAEVGGQDTATQQAWAESVMNRASARGMSISQAVSNSDGYYPRGSGSGKNPTDRSSYSSSIDKSLGGSNIAGYGTGNASGDVGFGKGGYATFGAGRGPSHERIGVEGADVGWVNRMKRKGADDQPPSKMHDVGGAYQMRQELEKPIKTKVEYQHDSHIESNRRTAARQTSRWDAIAQGRNDRHRSAANIGFA